MKNRIAYLQRQKTEYFPSVLPTHFKTNCVVVIPCYNEDRWRETLDNLCSQMTPENPVAVIVVVNSGENSPAFAVENNRETFRQLCVYAREKSTEHRFFLPLLFEHLPRKHAGVGLARKIGMDIAVRYFTETQNPNGILVSLDADCHVSENYLTAIHATFRQYPKTNCLLFSFLHRLENDSPRLKNAIEQYEKYITYQRRMLRYIGFPYYYHTIGSAFAVKADAYVKVGGMGRQQGGEDFYFLQKIFALGNIRELADVFVYPLARLSDRIPFGTGPALQKIMDAPDETLRVYSVSSFEVLKKLMDTFSVCFEKEDECVADYYAQQDAPFRDFMSVDEFCAIVCDCNQNSASWVAFEKRFFHHFNAFKIIKYLNFVHESHFALQPIVEISAQFL